MQKIHKLQLALIPEVINDRIEKRKKHMGELGKIGGKSKSERKLKAIVKNLAKAQAARWPGRPRVVKGPPEGAA